MPCAPPPPPPPPAAPFTAPATASPAVYFRARWGPYSPSTTPARLRSSLPLPRSHAALRGRAAVPDRNHRRRAPFDGLGSITHAAYGPSRHQTVGMPSPGPVCSLYPPWDATCSRSQFELLARCSRLSHASYHFRQHVLPISDPFVIHHQSLPSPIRRPETPGVGQVVLAEALLDACPSSARPPGASLSCSFPVCTRSRVPEGTLPKAGFPASSPPTAPGWGSMGTWVTTGCYTRAGMHLERLCI